MPLAGFELYFGLYTQDAGKGRRGSRLEAHKARDGYFAA